MQWDHEIVIVGGGMVGAALAARLGQAGMSVGLVERASAPTPPAAITTCVFHHSTPARWRS